MAHPVEGPPHHTSHRINLLPEYQRNFVDEYVTYHTSRSPGDAAHDDGHPEGIAQRDALAHADHREQCQADTVEYEERIVQMDEMFTEEDDPQQGQSGTNQVNGIRHPARGDVQQQVAYRTAANGRHKTHHIRSKPVEPLGRGQAYATDGKGKCANEIEYLNKCWHYHFEN